MRILVGLTVLLVALPVISAILAPVTASSPYLSALSNVGVSSTLAAHCPMTYCNNGVCDSPGKASACVVNHKTGQCSTALCNA